MKVLSFSLCLALGIAVLSQNCNAFVSTAATLASVSKQRLSSSFLSALLFEDDEDDESPESNRNDRASSADDLMPSSRGPGLGKGATTTNVWDKIDAWKDQLSTQPLTSRRRMLLDREHALLQDLHHNNDAMDDLKDLWIQPSISKPLKMTHDLITRGHWERAETVLMLLIDETAALPALHQLATLYFVQGRFEECRALHQLVLQHKPWYFDSIESMVQVCETLGEERNAQHWRNQKLPPLHEAEQRSEWVERMVARSRDLQTDAEQSLQTYFGTGSYQPTAAEGHALVQEGADSWQ